mgnify:CR=1 FL=1
MMSLAEAKKQAADPKRDKLPDHMMDVLHSSDLKGEVYWRQWQDPMPKEQAEDLVKVWDMPQTMTYEEYDAKWKRK